MTIKWKPVAILVAFAVLQLFVFLWHPHIHEVTHQTIQHTAPIIKQTIPHVHQLKPIVKECHDGFYVYPC